MFGKHVPLTGAWNVRELGGTTTDGRRVAPGRLFRSDGLDLLSRDDKALLASIPIKTVVDFRSEEEQNRYPDILPDSVDRYLTYSIIPGKLTPSDFRGASGDRSKTLMMSMYEKLVSEPDSLTQYRQFFAVLQAGRGLPLLFHCSAGKDRTGVAAALVLSALGVDERVIMDDYLASAAYLDGKYPSNEGIFSVAPEFLYAAFTRMTQECGSVLKFIEDALDVNTARLRELFLE